MGLAHGNLANLVPRRLVTSIRTLLSAGNIRPYHKLMLRVSLAVAVLLAIAGVTLALAWPSPSPNGDNGQITGLYENTTEGFSVVLPEGWVGQENETNLPLLSIEAQEGDPAVFSQVWIFPLNDESSAEAWADDQILTIRP